MAFNKKALNLFKNVPDHANHIREVVDIARTRLLVSAVCLSLGFLVVTGRLIDVCCLHHTGEMSSQAGDHIGLHMGRATLVDRSGEVLATTISTSSVYANAKIIQNPEEAAVKINKVFPDINPNQLAQRLKEGKSFVWIARHLTPQQKAAVIRLGIPGLEFIRDTRRVYPYGSLTAHVTGFVDIDNNGLTGIEHGMDSELRSQKDPVMLSIDIRIQHILYDELKRGIETYSAEGGSGMMIDAMTGEILAMVSLPDFDPNKPDIKNPQSLFNRNTLGVYEMGSTMKIINTAMALDSGQVTLDTKFDATKPMKVGKFFVTDFHAKNTWLNVSEIFTHSSNIGSAKMALRIGSEGQRMFMKRVGMLDTPQCELPEVGAPLSPQKWREANTITIAYGYGISVSPLHLSMAVAGIVNAGMMPKRPTLLRKDIREIEYTQVVKPSVSAQMIELMQEGVRSGTSKNAAVPGIAIGGKTGTANQRRAHGRGYQKKDVNTTFVGVFPEKPRYLIFVMLDGPKATKATYGYNTAGWNAAPVAGNVVKRSAPILGVYPRFDQPEEKMPLIREAMVRH